jgi:hypothetical protein
VSAVVNVFSYRGSSSDLSRVFIQPGANLLPSDNLGAGSHGIYEIAAMGTAAPQLRLVNVDNKEVGGKVEQENGELTQEGEGPLLGGSRGRAIVRGTAYHAVSASGETVFFTATPKGGQQAPGEETEKQTIYARVRHGEGATETAETIPVSNPSPSECTEKTSEKCAPVKETAKEVFEERDAPEGATYQGASADGSKVFFTTRQRLLGSDSDETSDLYEYDFQNPSEAGRHLPAGAVGEHLVQLSAGECAKENGEEATCGRGAEVQGIVRTSSDGSRVYFVANGLLTLKANGLKQKAKKAIYNETGEVIEGGYNLYVGDTRTGEVKFVAELSKEDKKLWGASLHGTSPEACSEDESGHSAETKAPVTCDGGTREAQTTPDGRYLVFGTHAHLIAADANPAQAIYRYDVETGQLSWISQGAVGFAARNEGRAAQIPSLPGSFNGAVANIDNEGRAISANGEYVMFSTEEKLSPEDNNGLREENGNVLETGNDVYLWHDGEVSLISPGQKGDEVDLGTHGEPSEPGLSASGLDVFFTTRQQLVGQDKDTLTDLYDARVNGGFPAPPGPPACFPGCQPAQGLPTFGSPASMAFGGFNVSTITNLTPEPPSVAISAAKLNGNTLQVTVKTSEPGSVTVSGAGLRTTTKTLAAGVNRLSLPLTSAGKRTKRHHGTTKIKATLKVGAATPSTTMTVRL